MVLWSNKQSCKQTPVKRMQRKMDRSKYAVLLIALSTISGFLSHINAQNPEVAVGEVFLLQLARSSFFKNTDALEADPIRYIASEVHRPDPPSWLHFLQRDAAQDGFLYGAPTDPSQTLSLEVVAVNERTYQTAYKIYNITVQPSTEDFGSLYVVELWIKNFNIEEIMKGNYIPKLNRKLSKIWKTKEEELLLVNVISMTTVTGRVPLPDNAGEQIKDGVVLQIGSFKPFSEDLLTVQQQIKDGRCDVDNAKEVEVDVDRRFEPDYIIDWCNMQMVVSKKVTGTEGKKPKGAQKLAKNQIGSSTPSSKTPKPAPSTSSAFNTPMPAPSTSSAPTTKSSTSSDNPELEPEMESLLDAVPLPLLTEDKPWQPRSAGIARQDLLLNFILTVLLPFGLGVILFVILSYILFGRREGKRQRDRLTPDSQLKQFTSIRHATTNLRFMSNHRDGLPTFTPVMGRTPSVTPGVSTVNTLSRSRVDMDSQGPPPYRLPPVYNPDTGLPNENGGDQVLAAAAREPAQEAAVQDQTEEDEQLMPQRSPETLKVRK